MTYDLVSASIMMMLVYKGSMHDASPTHGPLLLGVDRVRILTRDNLDAVGGDHIVRLHLESRILHDKRPDIVAKPVGAEVSLFNHVRPSQRKLVDTP